jgi:hypothetical protein
MMGRLVSILTNSGLFMALNVDLWMIVAYGTNNTYKALRVIGENYNLYYSVWCTNEHELYDLSVRFSLSPLLPYLTT